MSEPTPQNDKAGATAAQAAPAVPAAKPEGFVIGAVVIKPEQFQMAMAVAILSGLCCVAVSGILTYNYFSGGNVASLLEDQELTTLKHQLQKAPKDDKLKMKIRRRDWELRNNLFHRLKFDETGTYLAAFSFILFLGALKYALSLRVEWPNPLEWGARQAKKEKRTHMISGLAILGTGMLTVGFLIFLGKGSPGLAFQDPELAKRVEAPAASGADKSEGGAEGPGGEPAVPQPELPESYPSNEEAAKHWHAFRGPGGSGWYRLGKPPLEWDEKSGKNILWKTELALGGVSSPALWDNHIFITGADKSQRVIYCLNADNGKKLWEVELGAIKRASNEAPEVFEAKEGFAACSPVTDGKRVYAVFANGDIAAANFKGKIVWAHNLGLPNNGYGHSSSLTRWKNLILVQYDQDGSEGGVSALFGIDAATGEVAWETKRDYGPSWCSPIVIETESGPELITVTTPMLVSNDPATGQELWKADVMAGEVAPSPVFSDGLVIAAMADSGMAAVKPGGSGDVTKTQVAWQIEGDLPDTASPATNGTYVWVLTSDGILTCFNPKDGKVVWTKETDVTGYPSPTIANGHVYLTGEKGQTLIVKAGDKYEEAGKGKVDVKVGASLGFYKDRIIIRGSKRVYGIGVK